MGGGGGEMVRRVRLRPDERGGWVDVIGREGLASIKECTLEDGILIGRVDPIATTTFTNGSFSSR